MNISNNNQGQGLVEVIIAIAIIATGVVGALTLTFSSLSYSETSVKQIVAANLAREGIEIIRNNRDSNWLEGDHWLEPYWTASDYDGIIEFDPATNLYNLNTVPDYAGFDTNTTELLLNADNLYLHSSVDATGIPTGYHRMFYGYVITCQHNVSGNLRSIISTQTCNAVETEVGVKMVVEVRWQEKSGVKTYKLEENLYNWYEAN